MSRKVLLIEPNYKNKYPPLSLMKLATYHRMLGDDVTFYKGTDRDFAVNETMKLLMERLENNESYINWNKWWDDIATYIVKGGEARLIKILDDCESMSALSKGNLEYYRRYYYKKNYLTNPQWDRICITTLFTFYWDITVKAVNYYKQFCKDSNQVFVGGISASVVPNELERETGIKPIVGLLDKGGELDNNSLIIENLPLDYSILEEIDYVYPEHDGYYGYMTRGCVNKCAFCVVPKIEPTYQSYISISNRIEDTRRRFGEKRNLLLLDNNVLASECFDDIIEDIKRAGFVNGAKYIAPNYYEIAINNIKKKNNIPAYLKSLCRQYDLLLTKLSKSDDRLAIISLIDELELNNIHTITVKNVLLADKIFRPLFEKIYLNKPKIRYVDFNQGIDSRLINESNIKKLAEIPINPLRIAFDHWELRDIYEKSIRLSAANGINHLSNYLLYNFKDKPIELYQRMKLNIELCEQLDINIYSFPMKYHPIQDAAYFRERDYLGEYWNRKFIRAVQAILNSTKGKVGRGKEFFERAFGKDEKEFFKRLYMPEAMLIYRNYYEFETGMIDEWWDKFNNLDSQKQAVLKDIVAINDFTNIFTLTSDNAILDVLKYYEINRKVYELAKLKQRENKANNIKPKHHKND